MTEILPFSYKVKFKFLAFTNKNDVRQEEFEKEFKSESPLKNRKNAFEAFNDYLNILIEQKRVKLDKQGNYEIIRPYFIPDFFPETEDNPKEEKTPYNLDKSFIETERLKPFREQIEVLLVVNSKEFLEKTDQYDNWHKVPKELVIHRVASYEHNQQEIINNLELTELPLYEYFKIDYNNLKQSVFHYGVDFAESGEDEEAAECQILKTPHKWTSRELYEEIMYGKLDDDDEKYEEALDLAGIIANGESKYIEFKPTLLYNFKSQQAGFSIKHIIAKTICSFLNSDGGFLFIGIKDNGEIQGLNFDYSLFPGRNKKDKLRLEFDSLLHQFFGIAISPLITFKIVPIDDREVIIIEVLKSHKPIFLNYKFREKSYKEFFIRMSASSHQISDIEELANYILYNNWDNN